MTDIVKSVNHLPHNCVTIVVAGADMIPNIDKHGIRYGIISAWEVGDWLTEELDSHGHNSYHDSAVEDLRQQINDALAGIVEDLPEDDIGEIIGSTVDMVVEQMNDRDLLLSDEHQANNCLDKDGLKIQLDTDTDLWVFCSEYYTLCGLCSPCAPNAGSLLSEGEYKTYCLGPEWFDGKAPYRVYRVSDNQPV